MAVVMQSGNDDISRAVEPIVSSLDERIEPSKDVSIGPADVLCGRGRTSYNHGKSNDGLIPLAI